MFRGAGEEYLEGLYDEIYPTRGRSNSANRDNYFPSSHNTAPITLFPQSLVVDYFSSKNEALLDAVAVRMGVDLMKYIATERAERLDITDDASPVYHYMFSEAIKDDHIYDKPDLSRFKLVLEATCMSLEVETQALENHHPMLRGSLNSYIQKIRTDDNLLTSLYNPWSAKEFLELLRNKLQNIHVNKSLGDAPVKLRYAWRGIIVYGNDSLVAVILPNQKGRVFLMNYDQVLMITDTVISRFCTLLSCYIQEIADQNCLPSIEEVKKVYRWGDSLIGEYGFTAYAAIGEFESVITQCLITFGGADILKLADPFLEGIYTNEVELSEQEEISIGWVDELIDIAASVGSANKLSEIFGLRKHWGNPVLDAVESGRYVQLKAMEDYPINEDSLLTLLAAFQRMVVLEYIRINGRWPLVEFAELYSQTPLAIAYARSNTHINEALLEHEYIHWAHFRFLKNAELDLDIDSLKLLSDKACSSYRSHLDDAFLFAYRRDKTKKRKMEDSESRRILLEFLRREHYSVQDILNIVMSETIPEEWYVNLCSMKGTEMKHMKGRIFAVLCYELRQYFTATENIIKDHLFPYNPHQTMTMKERELLETLDKITSQLNPDAEGEYLNVLHIIDFSKWNLRMSYENTCLIFKSMDDFLGTPNLIEASHPIFMRLTNVVQDAFRPPTQGVNHTEDEKIWRLHRKGWEGQRQKGWTMLTSALLAYIEHETGVSSQIIGQGDNQVLCSKFRVPEKYRSPRQWIEAEPDTVKILVDNFYDTLVSECLKVGLPVKKSESCRSLVFCNYGKRLHYLGIELSMELKRIARMATEANASFPTSDVLCTTLTGSASAAPIYGVSSLVSPFLNNFTLATILLRAFRNNPLVGNSYYTTHMQANQRLLTAEFICHLMWLPTSLGGPSKTILFGSMYRGHPDPVAAEFANLTMCARSGSVFHKKLLCALLNGDLYFDRPNQKKEDCEWGRSNGFDMAAHVGRLIRSPFSINCKRPPLAQGQFQRLIGEAIRSSCKNPELMPLFSSDMDEQETSLIKALSTMTPFLPTVANDIYCRSLPGRKATFLSGFKHTTSFSRLLKTTMVSPLILIREKEFEMLEFWDNTIRDINSVKYDNDLYVPDHHVLLQTARCESWGIEVYGVTVPHPVEAICVSYAPSDVCSSTCLPVNLNTDHLVINLLGGERTKLPGACSDTRLLQRLRGKKGYTGNIMEEGMTCKTMKAISKSDPLIDAVRLNTLKKWTSCPNGKLSELLGKLIKSRTDISESALDCLTGVPARLSYTHRAALMSSQKSCSPSCITNLHTQIYISSDRFSSLNSSDNNKAFVFGQTYLFCQHLIGLLVYYSPNDVSKTTTTFHGHVYLNEIHDVYDGRLDTTTGSLKKVKRPRKCRHLFAKKSRVQLEFTGSQTWNDIWQTMAQTSVRVARIAYGTQALGNLFSRESRMRALTNTENVQLSNYRGCSISVGDISLIGIEAYVDAIANSLTLLTPYDISSNCLREQQGPVLDNFLRCIGSNVWSQLCAPLLVPRLLEPLSVYGFEFRTDRLGESIRHVSRLMKKLVLRTMMQLLDRLKTEMCGRFNESKIIIFSDGIDSSLYLYSRYIELCFSVVDSLQASFSVELLLTARKVINILHDLKDAPFIHIVETAERLFIEAQDGRYYTQAPLILPRPKFVDINQDWHLKLSQYKTPDSAYEPPNYFDCKKEIPVISLVKTSRSVFFSANTIIRMELVKCDCVRFTHVAALQIHRVKMPSGIISKTHYPVLEAIAQFQLPVSKVMVLGSTSGSDAAALTFCEVVETVYHNPLADISRFSHHSAGVYVPPEFLGGVPKDKLHFPNRAIMGFDSLAANGLRDAVLKHTEDYLWNGIILVRMLDEEKNNLISRRCLLDELKQTLEIFIHRCGAKGWLMVISEFSCNHELGSAVSMCGLYFSDIQILNSLYFSHHGGPLILIATKLKNTEDRFDGVIPKGLFNIFVGDEQERIRKVWEENMSRQVPEIFSATKIIDRQFRTLNSTLHVGYKMAQMRFLPGWVADIDQWSLDAIGRSLLNYVKSCSSGERIFSNVQNRMSMNRKLTSSQLLALHPEGLEQQLNETGVLMLKADILLYAVGRREFDLGDVCKVVVNKLTDFSANILYFKGLKISYTYSQFCFYDSGDFFELVQKIRNQNMFIYGKIPLPVNIHFKEEVFSKPISSPLRFIRIPEDVEEIVTVDSRWVWPLRSEFLFVLFCKSVSKSGDVVLYGNFSPIVCDFFKKRGIRKIGNIRDLMKLPQSSVISCWEAISWNDLLSTGAALNNVCLGRVLMSNISEIRELGVYNDYMSAARPLWEGVAPAVLWIKIDILSSLDLPDNSRFDFDWSSTTSRWVSRNEVTNCCCRDCAGEQELLEKEDELSADQLDSLCSSECYSESVFDHYH